jgi:hypothetical protein
MYLALSALAQPEPGASPQEIELKLGMSAEGATHGVRETRFSAEALLDILNAWGNAPGWAEQSAVGAKHIPC